MECRQRLLVFQNNLYSLCILTLDGIDAIGNTGIGIRQIKGQIRCKLLSILRPLGSLAAGNSGGRVLRIDCDLSRRRGTLAVRNRNLNEFLARNGRNGQIAALIRFCIEHHVVAIGVVLQITVLEGIATRREGLLGCTAGPGNVVRRGREIKLDGLGSCSGSLGLRQLYRSERLAADLGNQLGREGGIGGVVTGNRYRYRRSVLRGDAELVGIGTLDGHIDAAP